MVFTVSVKHYLNENLKAYKIGSGLYYPVYLLITAQRRTTKIKSIRFEEFYTEKDFKRINNTNDAKEEREMIRLLVETQVNEFKVFDTELLSALVNFMPNYHLINSEALEKPMLSFLEGYSDFLSSALRQSKFSEQGITFIDWFNPVNQTFFQSRLKETRALVDLNSIVLLAFFHYLGILLPSMKRYKGLQDRYFHTIDSYQQLIDSAVNRRDD